MDKRVWTDPSTGLVCMHRRCADGGYLCGYVAVEPGHPLYGWSHAALPADLGVTAHRGLNESGLCQAGIESEAMCHVPEPGRPEDVWWFGFKCDRAGDLLPQAGRGRGVEYRGEEYRGTEYVAAECGRLAASLAALARPVPLPPPALATLPVVRCARDRMPA